jgi:hypothetical protein
VRNEFTDSDKLRIVDSLGLWRPGLLKFYTAESHTQKRVKLDNWYEPTPTIEGVEFGRRWREYIVQYLGWDLGLELPADWYCPPNGFEDILLPNKPDRAIRLCGLRVYYKHSESFAEILLRDRRSDDPTTQVGKSPELDEPHKLPLTIVHIDTIDSIQNVQKCISEDEIKRVWRGFDLFKYLLNPQGRPKGRTEWTQEQIDAATRRLTNAAETLRTMKPPKRRTKERMSEQAGINIKTLDDWLNYRLKRPLDSF